MADWVGRVYMLSVQLALSGHSSHHLALLLKVYWRGSLQGLHSLPSWLGTSPGKQVRTVVFTDARINRPDTLSASAIGMLTGRPLSLLVLASVVQAAPIRIPHTKGYGVGAWSGLDRQRCEVGKATSRLSAGYAHKSNAGVSADPH